MIPVGLRGSSREERFAAYLAVEAIIERVTPEQLSRRDSWRGSGRRKGIPALEQLDSVFRIMSDFGFQWGPTGSVGFELATGVPAATKDSDLDLLVRAPDELERDMCRRARTRLSAQVSVRTDVLIETGAGAIALDEYARGDLPILLRSSNGPKLVYHPWKFTF
jgi:phosphoribosyl-dephospho-CoA transferase